MTELDYVISKFDKAFDQFQGRKIILHGSREYADSIIREFDHKYKFEGVITFDDPGSLFAGKTVYNREDLETVKPDLVILTERVKYAEAAFQDIKEICQKHNISIFNMYGVDEIRLHSEYETTRFKQQQQWKADIYPYDIIIFELMDVFLFCSSWDTGDDYSPRPAMVQLARFLKKKGKKVLFSLRKSFSQERQIEYLKESGLFRSDRELADSVIIRKGEDLSFRTVNEQYPNEKKCYLGSGLINEYILPACYGITPFRVTMEGYKAYDFDYVLKKLVSDSRKTESQQEDTNAAAREKIEKAEIICFDIFDTIITRKTLSPEDAMKAWGKYICKRFPEIPHDIAELRATVQWDHPTADIYEIYDLMKEMTGLSEEQADTLLKSELEFENKLLIRRNAVCELLEFAVQNGKEVYLISDTYYTEKMLRELLTELGIKGYSRIFASCDQKKTKYDGLFALVENEAGEGKTFLMIGNDVMADMYWGKKSGYEICHIPSPTDIAMNTGWKTAIELADGLAERGLLGIVISEIFNDPFGSTDALKMNASDRLSRFTVSACAPVIIGYTIWLINMLKKEEHDRILFSSRDGYILQKIYRLFLEKITYAAGLPEDMYFYISRHAAFLTCMDDPEKMEIPLNSGSFMSGPEVLNRYFDIDDEDFIERNECTDRKEFLLKNIEAIREKSRKEKANYQIYLENNGLTPEGKYVLADFVSIGTSQDMLEAGCNLNLDGMYVGMPPYDWGNDVVIRYYFGEKHGRFRNDYMEMECIMTSPEGSLNSFDHDGNPVFAPERRNAEELRQVETAHLMIENVARDFLEIYFDDTSVVRADFAEAMYAADGAHGILRDAYDDWGGFPLTGEQFFPENLRSALFAWYPFRKGASVLELTDGKELSADEKDKYDYILIRELPERDSVDICKLLQTAKSILKPDGIMLLGFHNRNAAKYKCGGLDRLVTESFGTHRLYSRDEVLEAAEKIFDEHREYYPMPAPEFVQAVYTDEYLPTQGIKDRVFAFDAYSSPLVMDENEYYDKMLKNGSFGEECNYYLIEIGGRLPERHVIHAALSADRPGAHAFATVIWSDDTVSKAALQPEGIQTLQGIADNMQIMREEGIKTVDCELAVNTLNMPRCKEQSALDYFIELADKGDRQQIIATFRRLYEDICKFCSTTGKACLDMVPYNAFVKNGEFIYFDQEYTEDCPAEYVIWRAIHYTYIHLPDLENVIGKDELMESFGITAVLSREFEAKEQMFTEEQRQVKLYERIYEWKKKSKNIRQDF